MAAVEWLADEFEAHRAHLRSVAYRMLGSASEADDAVQETWIRLSRTDTSDIENSRAEALGEKKSPPNIGMSSRRNV